MNTTTLQAFHNQLTIKQKYMIRLADHRAKEHLVQGTGWAVTGLEVRGCAVGCTLERYDQSLYPIELGLPEWAGRLEDYLFEHLPKSEAEQFAEDFLAVIPVGANIEPVRHKLAIRRIDKSLERLVGNVEPYADECRKAIELVKLWHESMIESEISESAARSAESAESAESARSAESAAWSAARSARSAESAA